MKNAIRSTLLFVLLFTLSACVSLMSTESEPVKDNNTKAYNATLAQELGADDYGMRSYVFAVLITGPEDANITDKDKRGELFKGHFSNMGRLAGEKKLLLAGPFIDGGVKRGLFIFNVTTIEEAQELVKTDPAVAAGIFEVEFTKYYGSAALMKIQELHTQIQKVKVG